MRTLGDAIDTTMATMTPKSIVDAKGDIVAASANDTPARLAVGANGTNLVADSSTTTGLRYQDNFAAGKNKIINGNFGIWQRGTSFAANVYCADRWLTESDGTAPVTQQTFTPGTAPVAGYEGQFFLRQARTASGTFQIISQRVEDVRTFAGQTITVSFWAKADATVTNSPNIVQNFGSGGSADVTTTATTQTITTSWARYSYTINVPSISGKTIGASSYLMIRPIRIVTATAHTIDVWGVQAEAASVASAFQTATGSIQGELAACQRYYQRQTAEANLARFGVGGCESTTAAVLGFALPVKMRTAPTALEQSGTATDYSIRFATTNVACSAVPLFNTATTDFVTAIFTVASGLVAGNNAMGRYQGTAGYLGWSAEL
jgi:hypothetical protein